MDSGFFCPVIRVLSAVQWNTPICWTQWTHPYIQWIQHIHNPCKQPFQHRCSSISCIHTFTLVWELWADQLTSSWQFVVWQVHWECLVSSVNCSGTFLPSIWNGMMPGSCVICEKSIITGPQPYRHQGRDADTFHDIAITIIPNDHFSVHCFLLGNTFDGNLVVFCRMSSSLRNDDITPAAFWITNADNTVKDNRVAGGPGEGTWGIFDGMLG